MSTVSRVGAGASPSGGSGGALGSQTRDAGQACALACALLRALRGRVFCPLDYQLRTVFHLLS